MLSHKSSIDAHEKVNAMATLRNQLGQFVYPLHRLDKPTSGLLLFALDPQTAALLTEQFTKKQIVKKYHAVVRGYTPDVLTIDYPLKKMQDKKDKHKQKAGEPQEAVTNIKTLATAELPFSTGKYPTSRFSLIEAQPLTGRQRQIRRHLKHIYHPIVGDTAHGDGKQNMLFREQFNCHRLLLHAHSLRLQHPHNGEELSIEANLNMEFKVLVKEVFDDIL